MRRERMASYAKEIEQAVLTAAAAGATMGQIKEAYGTKDHRTVSAIIHAGNAEIAAIQEADKKREVLANWFVIDGDQVKITLPDGEATFKITSMEEEEILPQANEPRWNEDWTVENKIVAMFDGFTSDELPEIEAIRKAWVANG